MAGLNMWMDGWAEEDRLLGLCTEYRVILCREEAVDCCWPRNSAAPRLWLLLCWVVRYADSAPEESVVSES
jgi:hypothetical protein